MDLQNKIATARNAGYSDQEIQSYLAKSKMSQGAGRAGGLKGLLLDVAPFGRVAEKVVNPNAGQITGGELATEAALSAIPFGLGRIAKGVRGARGLAGAIRSTEKPAQTTEAAMQARKGLMQRTGEKLSAAGSNLKVGENVGDINKFTQQSQTVARYSGTPKTQLKKIDADMKMLSTQVDDILSETPVKLDGSLVGQRLQRAGVDLTDERFADLDINNPSVKTIIDRYSEKFAKAQDAKGVNDIVKTLNKTATRAQKKLENPNAAPLTSQETAALALKRAGDDALSEISAIAPLKQQMAQLFEINPQVARATERGFGLPFMSGTKVKAPMQLLQGAQSKAGAFLQGAGSVPAVGGFRPFIKPAVQQAGVRLGADALGVRPKPETASDTAQFTTPFVSQPSQSMGPEPQSSSLFADPALLEQAYTEAIARGDAETANALIKGYELFGKPKADNIKKTETQRARDEAAALTESAIGMLEQGSISTGLFGANLERAKAMFSAGDQETIDFNNVISNLRATIAKARGGSSFTETEKAMLNQYTPKVGDSGQELRSKLFNLQQIYKAAQEREYGTQYTEPAAAQVPA